MDLHTLCFAFPSSSNPCTERTHLLQLSNLCTYIHQLYIVVFYFYKLNLPDTEDVGFLT